WNAVTFRSISPQSYTRVACAPKHKVLPASFDDDARPVALPQSAADALDLPELFRFLERAVRVAIGYDFLGHLTADALELHQFLHAGGVDVDRPTSGRFGLALRRPHRRRAGAGPRRGPPAPHNHPRDHPP